VPQNSRVRIIISKKHESPRKKAMGLGNGAIFRSRPVRDYTPNFFVFCGPNLVGPEYFVVEGAEADRWKTGLGPHLMHHAVPRTHISRKAFSGGICVSVFCPSFGHRLDRISTSTLADAPITALIALSFVGLQWKSPHHQPRTVRSLAMFPVVWRIAVFLAWTWRHTHKHSSTLELGIVPTQTALGTVTEAISKPKLSWNIRGSES